MLRVQLFGTGHAQYLGQPVPGFPNSQAGLLFSYLLLNRTYSYNRDQIATIFWGDFPSNSARKNLRNILWRLKQSLQSVGAQAEQYLLASEDVIAYANLGPCWIDVDLFDSTAQEVQEVPGHALTQRQLEQLNIAVDLYVGDLLEGVYDDWVLYDRERLRLGYLNLLNKLMVFYGSQGGYEHAIEIGGRILSREPTRENVHRHMMEFYICTGNHAAALAQYKQCSQILRNELNSMPMEETKQLYEQILHNRFDPDSYLARAAKKYQSRVEEQIPQSTQYALQQIKMMEKRLEETTADLYRLEQFIRRISS